MARILLVLSFVGVVFVLLVGVAAFVTLQQSILSILVSMQIAVVAAEVVLDVDVVDVACFEDAQIEERILWFYLDSSWKHLR